MPSKINRLVLTKGVAGPIYVTLRPQPFVWPSASPAPLLDEGRLHEAVSNHSFKESATICVLVDCELKRRGYYRAQAGGHIWNAAEARVVSDVVAFGLDLWELAAQIEEARYS